jgi:hypothetical protein
MALRHARHRVAAGRGLIGGMDGVIDFDHKFQGLSFDNAGLPNTRWLFLFNSNFLRMNEAHRSAGKIAQRFDHPPPPAPEWTYSRVKIILALQSRCLL